MALSLATGSWHVVDVQAKQIVYWNKKSVTIKDASGIAKLNYGGIEGKLPRTYKNLRINFPSQKKFKLTWVNTKGKKTTKTYYVDWTKPSVSGVKNGATYKKAVQVSVADEHSGLKYVKVNGVKMKKKFKLDENGSYLVEAKDKSGNIQKVKFSIRIEAEMENSQPTTMEPTQGGNSSNKGNDVVEEAKVPGQPGGNDNKESAEQGEILATEQPVIPTSTVAPTTMPTTTPNVTPTIKPTVVPTEKPIVTPTIKPTVVPTNGPTATPRVTPAVTPTLKPSSTPTIKPTSTPKLDDTKELDENWKYTLNPIEKTVTLEKYQGTSSDVFVKKGYYVEGEYVNTVLKEAKKVAGIYGYSYSCEGPFCENDKIKKVEFEDGLSIKNVNYMFYYCKNLEQVEGLKGDFESMTWTFRECVKFNQKIEIPNSVKEMDSTFESCEALNVSPQFGKMSQCESMESTFKGCSNFEGKDFQWPIGVIKIDYIFYQCKKLDMVVTIPDTVVSASYAFSGCSSIKKIEMSSKLSKIEKLNGMFLGCEGLTSVNLYLGKQVSDIQKMFKECNKGIEARVVMAGVAMKDSCENAFDGLKGTIYIYPFDTGAWENMHAKMQDCELESYTTIYI